MSPQGYNQYCALAHALDLVGDRWTLLIVRELAPGPRRFTDLIDGLPGIPRNLLTERLRSLERDGIVVRRDLPPPAARQVYALTEDGGDLARAISPLIGWGARRQGKRKPDEAFHPRWPAVAMAGLADRKAAVGISENYQFHVDDFAFYFTIDDGLIEVHDGEADDAALKFSTDTQTWAKLAGGTITYARASKTGALSVEGDRKVEKRFRNIFSRGPILAHSQSNGRAKQPA